MSSASRSRGQRLSVILVFLALGLLPRLPVRAKRTLAMAH